MANRAAKSWSGKSRGGRWGYLFFVGALRFLGVRGAYACMAFIVLYFIPFAPRATRAVWRYHRRRRHLGRCRALVALYRHYYSFGQTLIDRLALRSGMVDKYHFVFDNYDPFLEVIDSGRGVVMIGAHVGMWEAGAAFFGGYGKKINIVMYDAEHQRIKEVLEQEEAGGHDYKIISVKEDPIEALLQMKIALNAGEYVCFNGDRPLDMNSAEEVSLLGAPAMMPRGPFLIAAKCRVPVVFYYAMRERRRTYRFRFTMVSSGEKLEPKALMTRYAASLEELLAIYPYQWFNLYPYWKE